MLDDKILMFWRREREGVGRGKGKRRHSVPFRYTRTPDQYSPLDETVTLLRDRQRLCVGTEQLCYGLPIRRLQFCDIMLVRVRYDITSTHFCSPFALLCLTEAGYVTTKI
jgi:hypothetical protein